MAFAINDHGQIVGIAPIAGATATGGMPRVRTGA
jgi:hypothetical protein